MIIRGDRRKPAAAVAAAPPQSPAITPAPEVGGPLQMDAIPWNGQTWSVKQLAARCGISHQLLRYRLGRGQPIEQAIKKPASGSGRPIAAKTKPREPVIVLPEGMTDEILAWACGLSPKSNSVYRWRTDQHVPPDVAFEMIDRWGEIPRDQFFAEVSRRNGAPPIDTAERTAAPDSIKRILREHPDGLTLAEIEERLRNSGLHVTHDSLKAILTRMRARGAITKREERPYGHWRLAG